MAPFGRQLPEEYICNEGLLQAKTVGSVGFFIVNYQMGTGFLLLVVSLVCWILEVNQRH